MTADIDTTLTLGPATRVDYHWAELDANAINFHLPEPHGYFSIAVGLFLEGDDQLDSPDFEMGDQQRHGGAPEALRFEPGVVELRFDPRQPFLGRHRVVRITVGDALDRRMVDFFVNALFFGAITEYADDVDVAMRVEQTEFRCSLDDLPDDEAP